jgi:hypothetical protein
MKTTEFIELLEKVHVGKFFAIILAICLLSGSIALGVAWYVTRR